MKNWLKALRCILNRHNVVVGEKCPVTGIKKLTCSVCGASNMPQHSGGMSFK